MNLALLDPVVSYPDAIIFAIAAAAIVLRGRKSHANLAVVLSIALLALGAVFHGALWGIAGRLETFPDAERSALLTAAVTRALQAPSVAAYLMVPVLLALAVAWTRGGTFSWRWELLCLPAVVVTQCLWTRDGRPGGFGFPATTCVVAIVGLIMYRTRTDKQLSAALAWATASTLVQMVGYSASEVRGSSCGPWLLPDDRTSMLTRGLEDSLLNQGLLLAGVALSFIPALHGGRRLAVLLAVTALAAVGATGHSRIFRIMLDDEHETAVVWASTQTEVVKIVIE